ncbi:DUF7322 domain-containing protein [Haloplanus ruber]|uniref:DUF7322 domain-containing protein n=1 Tax=Haloplanus ruber TaxID=869892 RepID=A0ABD6D0P5_9EURY|nr:hypothetical protein [Haloplanus ruber]
MPSDPWDDDDAWDDDAEKAPAEKRASNLGPDPPTAPAAPTPDIDPSDVDPEVQGLFWRSVLMANVAVFCLAFGPMLIGFRGQWRTGLGLVLVGAVAGLRVYHLYRTFQRRSDADSSDTGTDEHNP